MTLDIAEHAGNFRALLLPLLFALAARPPEKREARDGNCGDEDGGRPFVAEREIER